jgi:hypothetical protein
MVNHEGSDRSTDWRGRPCWLVQAVHDGAYGYNEQVTLATPSSPSRHPITSPPAHDRSPSAGTMTEAPPYHKEGVTAIDSLTYVLAVATGGAVPR